MSLKQLHLPYSLGVHFMFFAGPGGCSSSTYQTLWSCFWQHLWDSEFVWQHGFVLRQHFPSPFRCCMPIVLALLRRQQADHSLQSFFWQYFRSLGAMLYFLNAEIN